MSAKKDLIEKFFYLFYIEKKTNLVAELLLNHHINLAQTKVKASSNFAIV